VRRRLPAVATDNDEVVAELAAQLEDAYDAALARGADESEALREVHAEVLGDARAWQQLDSHLQSRRGWPTSLGAFATVSETIDAVRRHARQGKRYLRREIHFAAAVSLTLALCAGVAAAVFTVTNAVLLRPLPFPDPQRVVLMAPNYRGRPTVNIRSDIPSYFDRRQRLTVFDEMAMFRWIDVVLQTPSGAQRVRGDITTSSLFRLLRVAPLHGRLIEPGDEQPGTNRKIVLSHGLWQELFDGQPSAVGRDLLVNGEAFRVVGVMPQDFAVFRLDARFWIPAVYSTEQRADGRRSWSDQYQIGRLRDGVTLDDVRRELAAFDQSESARFPTLRAMRRRNGYYTAVEPLQDVITREVRPTLLLLAVGSGVVLSLGLLNIATLTIARSRRYVGEFATRHALGGRWRSIAAPLLTQSAVIASIGGAGALAVAGVLLAVMKRVGLREVPRADSVGLDGAGVLVCLVAVVIAAVIIAMAPLLAAASVSLPVALRDAARDRAAVAGARYLRRALVVGQVATAFVLTATMGWILVSLFTLLSENPGFTPAGLVTVSFDVPRQMYRESAEANAIVRRVLAAANQIAGVETAGITQLLPLGGRTASWEVRRSDQTLTQATLAWNYVVSPGYFGAMQVPLHAGRYLEEGDSGGSEPVVVIARSLAAQLWPGVSPIGQQLVFPPAVAPRPFTVVGVVGDVRQASLTEGQSAVAVYRTYAQTDERSFTLAARARSTELDPESLAAAIRSVDARLAPYDAAPMLARVSASVAPRRLALTNAAVFAGTALLLATVGLYAVLTYLVAERRREFGIRLALGSSPRSLASGVVGEGMVMVVAGLGVGGVVLRWLRPVLEPHLYGVGAWDVPILLAAGVLVTATAVIGSLAPAVQASRVDPLLVLQG
jgi:putative ABC transport system permease protein